METAAETLRTCGRVVVVVGNYRGKGNDGRCVRRFGGGEVNGFMAFGFSDLARDAVLHAKKVRVFEPPISGGPRGYTESIRVDERKIIQTHINKRTLKKCTGGGGTRNKKKMKK